MIFKKFIIEILSRDNSIHFYGLTQHVFQSSRKFNYWRVQHSYLAGILCFTVAKNCKGIIDIGNSFIGKKTKRNKFLMWKLFSSFCFVAARCAGTESCKKMFFFLFVSLILKKLLFYLTNSMTSPCTNCSFLLNLISCYQEMHIRKENR